MTNNEDASLRLLYVGLGLVTCSQSPISVTCPEYVGGAGISLSVPLGRTVHRPLCGELGHGDQPTPQLLLFRKTL